jgi:hypothetical protein
VPLIANGYFLGLPHLAVIQEDDQAARALGVKHPPVLNRKRIVSGVSASPSVPALSETAPPGAGILPIDIGVMARTSRFERRI